MKKSIMNQVSKTEQLVQYILKPNQLVGVVVRDIVISAGRGGSRWGYIPPTSYFQTWFLMIIVFS